MKLLRLFVIAALLSLTVTAHAYVTYTITSDGVPDAGYSYWALVYSVTNTTTQPVIELNLYFDANLYYALYDYSPMTGWDTLNTNNTPYTPLDEFPYPSYIQYNAIATGAGIAPNGGVETFSFKAAYYIGGAPGGEAPQNQWYQTFSDTSGTPLVSGYTSVVPEPTTYVLLTISLGVVALARRRMMGKQ